MAKKRKLQQHGTPDNSSKKRQQQGGGKPHKAAGKPHKQHHIPAADPDPDAAAEQEEEEELAVSDEDVEFVQQYGQQLGFLQQLNPQELERSIKVKQQKQKEAVAAAAAAAAAKAAAAAAGDGDDSDAEAEEYERRPRAAEQERKGPSTQGLPVKTAAGEVVFAPNKQQQRLLTASRIQVEGVTVEDDLAAQQKQQQQQQQKMGGRKGRAAEAAAAAEEEEKGASESEEEGEPSAAAKVAQQVQKVAAEQPDLPAALLSLMSIADQARRREAMKQQMALAAQHLLAEPEKHIGPGLRLLSVCACDADGVVARLALLSLLAVFKDLLPGYRIRGVSGEEAQMKVSKEVQALRDFEAALLKGYQAYLKTLLAAATAAANSSSSSSARLATARVAVRCMGQLLVAKPGFNYSSDLLQALVPQMVSPDREIAQLAVDAVRMLLQEDIQGKTSLEGVQLVADLVRKKRCVLDPSVVGALLVLRFEAVTPTQQGGEGVGRQAQKGGKKGRKRSKKKSDLERDLEEAQAAPDARELALLQSQMLEALFEVFFRVLKHCAASTSSSINNSTAAADPAAAAAAEPLSSSGSGNSAAGVLTQPWPAAKVHRKFPLLQPTLTGLGRYSHLISVEYFNDLMGVLQELLSTGALPVRERLCVLLAALDILRGQGEALTIDRRAFYNQLYNTLQLVPLSVLYEGLTAAGSSGSGQGSQQQPGKSAGAAAAAEGEESEQELLVEVQRALDAVRISQLGWEAAAPGSSSSTGSSAAPQQQQQPTAVLLLRCLEQQLLGVKQTDMARLAAFVKRLAGLMLSCSVGEALGAACLLWRLLKRYPKLLCLLEWEGGAPVGGQQYEPYCEDPSEAGAMASALWELPLLSQHYHPHTAAAAKLLLTLTPGSSRSQGAAAAGEREGGDEATAAGGGGGRAAAGVGAIAGVLAGALGPQQVAATYEPVRRGGFRPGPQVPRQGSGGQQGKGAAGGSSKAQMAARVAAAAGPLTGSLLAAVQQQQQESAAAVAAAGAGASAAAAAVVAVNGAQQSGSSRKRKQQQQPGADTKGFASRLQQQQQVAAAVEGVDMQAVEAAVRQQYRLSWQHQRNQQLRRQAAIAARKVELFREHLIRKHQEQQQQQQQQVRKKQRVSGSGAGQHKKRKSQNKAQQH